MNIFTVFKETNVPLCSFRQLPLNLNAVLIPVETTKGARLLSVAAECLIASVENPLDFHEEIIVRLFLINVLNYFIIGLNTK